MGTSVTFTHFLINITDLNIMLQNACFDSHLYLSSEFWIQPAAFKVSCIKTICEKTYLTKKPM